MTEHANRPPGSLPRIDAASREATLLEVVAALPRGHRARTELGALLEVARHDLRRLPIERRRATARRVANEVLDEQGKYLHDPELH